MARGKWGIDPRLWGTPTCGRVVGAGADGYVMIETVNGTEFGGRYEGLSTGDQVLILTGDYWRPVAVAPWMGEGVAVIRAILDAPDDDLARSALSDWWQETGEARLASSGGG